MIVSLENQLAAAMKSLRTMFPRARLISVDFTYQSTIRSGREELECLWSIFVSNVVSTIGGDSISIGEEPDLAKAVEMAMVKGGVRTKDKSVVVIGSRQVSMN